MVTPIPNIIMSESDAVSPEERLLEILENPELRIVPLLFKSTNPKDRQAKRETLSELTGIVQHLFREIEETARKYHIIANQKGEEASEEKEPDEIPTLSGLSELYVPESDVAGGDAETLWGQVELQNNALNKLLKKSTKKLSKSLNDIVILDMSKLSSDDEEGEDSSAKKPDASTSSQDEEMDHDNDDDEEEEDKDEEDDDDDDEGDEDEETKRIRERMERAMDGSGSDEMSDGSDAEEQFDARDTEDKEDLFDPVAEEMKDGFFDLNDMEGFADEEEDYLPQEDYTESKEDKKKKKAQKKEDKSFHQKQRDGDLLRRSDDEDDEESFDDMYEEDEVPVKRNKYRDDEDIEALFSMYQGAPEDDKAVEDAANMTAADFFGAPSKKHMERYESKNAKDEVKGDDDSWGEYDFEQEENDNDRGRSRTRLNSAERELTEDESDVDSEEGGNKEQAIKEESRKVDTSNFAKQQLKLRKQTEQLESEMLAEKPWQMTGETKSTTRPVNSLLEGTPEFEMASKQAPTITIEHTTNLEDVIRKRILAEDWDDVVPRELPDVGWHKKRGEAPEVSQEKSKLGLGELYEREYLKKAVGYDKDAEEKRTEEDKAKDEMKALFANLCSKLDGLSNYHFAPRPIADEAEVRTSNTPAIAMEEVLPLHVNDARGVAPEEVYATKRGREGVLRGESEMDQQERKRLRQSKKTARRKVRKEKLADEKLISRLQPGLGLNNPYEKRKIREDLAMARSKGKITTGEKDMDGKYGSSGTFFKRLQAEVHQTIRGNPGEEEPQKKTKPKSSALKL